MEICPVRVEFITRGPYDGHTDVTMVKDGFRD